MGEEKIRTILKDFGLTEKEADIYILLARQGALSRGDIARSLKKDKAQISRILKRIQNKGVVEATLELPRRFVSVPFETIINLSIKTKREEATSIEEARRDLLQYLERSKKAGFELDIEKFVVVEQYQKIYSKISEMIEKTNNKMSVISNVSSLVRDNQFGLLNFNFDHPSKLKINFRFLTELSDQNLDATRTLLKRTTESGLIIRGRNPDLGLRLFPQMVIRDDEEILLFIKSRTDICSTNQNEVALWTNCKSIVNSFSCVFDELWRNSTDLRAKIAELETDKTEPATRSIVIAETLNDRYKKILSLAKREIIMITSSTNLPKFWENWSKTNELDKHKVSAKIMAPITRSNSEVVQHLAKFCEVRHVAAGNLETIIVDGRQLFQNKTSLSDQEGLKNERSSDGSFFIDNSDYVTKVKSMLDDLWKNAPIPSAITLNFPTQSLDRLNNHSNDTYTLSKPNSPYRKLAIPFEERPRAIAENEVIKKIMSAKKQNVKTSLANKAVFYGSRASAVIHPPKYLNLPEMIISVACWNDKSSFGSQNWLTVNLWQDTPKGGAFLPVAIVQDNSVGIKLKKQIYTGTPAAKNIQFIPKDEFQVQVYSNILFAGWTRSIPLISSKYIIPPSCLLFEGYGEVKPGIIRSGFPSGRRQTWEYNGLEAFVTFFLPSAKYSGPGTDGTISREVVLTSYPSKIENSFS